MNLDTWTFPDEVEEECKQAFREEYSRKTRLTEEEVRHDEADKAEWTYHRSRPNDSFEI